MRIDYQILLKSPPPLALLAGSFPVQQSVCRFADSCGQDGMKIIIKARVSCILFVVTKR